MSIIETYINTAVHKDLTEMFKVINPRSEDFELKLAGNEVYTIPSQTTLTFPYPVAMRMSIALAKQISYDSCAEKSKWKGLDPVVWMPIAETLISRITIPSKVVEKETEVEVKKITEDVVPEKEEIKTEIPVEEMKYNDLVKLATSMGIKGVGKKKEVLITLINDAK